MSRARFLFIACLLAPPTCAFTVLLMDLDMRLCAVSAEDISAVVRNMRIATANLAEASENAKQASANLQDASARLPTLLESQLDEMRTAADGRLRSIEDRIGTESAAWRREMMEQLTVTNGTLANAAAVREDLKPLLQDAQQSWDDLYLDVKASVASAAVATASVGRAGDSVARAMPEIAEAARVVSIEAARVAPATATHVESLTGDAAKIAHRMASPWSVLINVARKAGKFIWPF